jgi:hypothetical protein
MPAASSAGERVLWKVVWDRGIEHCGLEALVIVDGAIADELHLRGTPGIVLRSGCRMDIVSCCCQVNEPAIRDSRMEDTSDAANMTYHKVSWVHVLKTMQLASSRMAAIPKRG